MSTQSQVSFAREHKFETAERIHEAATARLEKRVLLWLAPRTPAAVNSDHLTALALAAQVLAGVAYALSSRWPAALMAVNFFIVLNWLGDSLDGTLARVRDRQRPRYGFYVDHIVDTLGALALMTGLAVSGYAHWQIAAGMLACFYILAIESYLATYALGQFQLSQGLVGPTEIRILLILANCRAYWDPYFRIAHHRFLFFDVGGAAAIAGMAVVAAIAIARHTILLYRRETLA